MDMWKFDKILSKLISLNTVIKINLLSYISTIDAVKQMQNKWSLRKRTTIHQVTTMLAISKNVVFPGHNQLLTTGTDDPSL